MLRSALILIALVAAAACDSGTKPPRPGPSRPLPTATLDGGSVAQKPTEPPPTQPPIPATETGEALYGTLCAKCHGPEAKGYAADNAPSLVSPTFLESATDVFLHASIAGGRPGSSMGAYSAKLGGPLDDEKIMRIIGFLRTKGPKAMRLDPANPGDATRGAKLYKDNCIACHGDPSVRKEAVHLANARFLEQANDAFLRHAILKGRPGTKMLAFGEVLTPQQVDDLVAHIRTFAGNAAGTEELLPPPTGTEPLVLNPKGKDPGFVARDGRFVPVDEVKKALDAKKKIIIIDARPPSDWRRVHVKGAVSIPYHDLTRLKEVPPDVTAIAYCACPHHLSGDVVDALIKMGHTKAYVLDEGINEWHRRGYPVVAAPGVKPPPTESPRLGE